MQRNKARDILVLPANINFEKIGEVDIETSQVLIMDPSYIVNNWKNGHRLGKRVYRHIATGLSLTFQVDFHSYDEIIPRLGRSVNAMIADAECEEGIELAGSELNYKNCGLTSRNPERGGVIGTFGTVVATPEGNEAYNVFVERDERGRVIRVLLDFTVGADEVDVN